MAIRCVEGGRQNRRTDSKSRRKVGVNCVARPRCSNLGREVKRGGGEKDAIRTALCGLHRRGGKSNSTDFFVLSLSHAGRAVEMGRKFGLDEVTFLRTA